ncbi:MAG TPA: O-antigen ligase family protein, partial [Verrucomicrobiae bacterium]|nr:O-antigen ligase family protein [Verrucomicrobiae bacterium]
MSTKEKILYSLSLLFFATFYMPSWAQTVNGVVIGLMTLFSFFFTTRKERWHLLKERKHIAAMVLFFFVVIASLLASENQDRGWRYLDTRLALCYLPVSIGLLQTRREFRDRVLLGFAVITTLACVVLLAWSIDRSGYFARPELLYNDSLTELIERQSIYIALLVTLSIFIYGYHLFYLPSSSRQKLWLGIGALFLYVVSYLLASRNMMVVLYGSTLGFLFYYILQKKQYIQGALLLTCLLAGIVLIFSFFPKTANRFKELTYTQFEYGSMGAESHYNMEVTKDQWNGANFRLAAWSCGWELFKRHPLTGVDLGDKRDELYKMYEEKGFRFALEHGKNVHSNYLDILYSMGIIAFSIFLFAWVLL